MEHHLPFWNDSWIYVHVTALKLNFGNRLFCAMAFIKWTHIKIKTTRLDIWIRVGRGQSIRQRIGVRRDSVAVSTCPKTDLMGKCFLHRNQKFEIQIKFVSVVKVMRKAFQIVICPWESNHNRISHAFDRIQPMGYTCQISCLIKLCRP